MHTVDVLLYEGMDELDVCGPYEVLASCRQVIGGKWSDRPAFYVEVVADKNVPLRCAHGLQIIPDKTLDRAREADIILVPGGPGAREKTLPPKLLEFLRKSYHTADVIASVSTGAFLLGRAGLADEYQITTHDTKTAELARLYPKAKVVSGSRVVVDGDKPLLMSSGGISAGIDLALEIIRRLESKEAARLAAKRIQWPISEKS